MSCELSPIEIDELMTAVWSVFSLGVFLGLIAGVLLSPVLFQLLAAAWSFGRRQLLKRNIPSFRARRRFVQRLHAIKYRRGE